MKSSFAALAIVLSGSAMGAPFSSENPIVSDTSAASTPIYLPSGAPLSSLFAASGTGPSKAAKRGEALSVPTDLPSLVSDVQSAAAALASASVGAQKRNEKSLPILTPTDTPTTRIGAAPLPPSTTLSPSPASSFATVSSAVTSA